MSLSPAIELKRLVPYVFLFSLDHELTTGVVPQCND